MNISTKLKKAIESSNISFSTVSKSGAPHTIYVACVKVIKDNILISDNYMEESIINIKQNNNVAIALLNKGKGLELRGSAKYFSCGPWLKRVKALPDNKSLPAKGAVVVSVSKIKKMA